MIDTQDRQYLWSFVFESIFSESSEFSRPDQAFHCTQLFRMLEWTFFFDGFTSHIIEKSSLWAFSSNEGQSCHVQHMHVWLSFALKHCLHAKQKKLKRKHPRHRGPQTKTFPPWQKSKLQLLPEHTLWKSFYSMNSHCPIKQHQSALHYLHKKLDYRSQIRSVFLPYLAGLCYFLKNNWAICSSSCAALII